MYISYTCIYVHAHQCNTCDMCLYCTCICIGPWGTGYMYTVVITYMSKQAHKPKRAGQPGRQLQCLPTKSGSLALQLMCLTFYIWLDLYSLWSVKWRQPPSLCNCLCVCVCVWVCVCVCVCAHAMSDRVNELVSVSGSSHSLYCPSPPPPPPNSLALSSPLSPHYLPYIINILYNHFKDLVM